MTKQNELTAARVAKGSIYLTLETVLITLISVTGFAVMARMITLTEMGVIAGLTLFSTFAIIISDFGLSATVLKYVSELRGKQEDLSKIIFSTTTLKALIVLITASILFIIAPYLSELLF
ncbi:oligosaccharide flippase family protein, partial [Candidatus Bathyarchaeota archaeon]|nr:oligosaccharide flippase family protein [Candidatus Bathyarchaeota archaeon]